MNMVEDKQLFVINYQRKVKPNIRRDIMGYMQ